MTADIIKPVGSCPRKECRSVGIPDLTRQPIRRNPPTRSKVSNMRFPLQCPACGGQWFSRWNGHSLIKERRGNKERFRPDLRS